MYNPNNILYESTHRNRKASLKRNRRMSDTATAGGKTVNKSCDTCSIKKRRCDGGRPCSRCVRRGDVHKCTYSTRRPYTRNRRARLWSSSTSSSEQEAVGTASAARMRSCPKTSIDTNGRGNNRDQHNTSHVVETAPTAGLMATPKYERSSPAIEEVYAELARTQQGVMSLIVSTNIPPLQSSSIGRERQTAMDHHPVSSLGNADHHLRTGVGFGYVETMPPQMVCLEDEQTNPKSSFPGLEIDDSVVATPAALVRDYLIDEDGVRSTHDLDVGILGSSSDGRVTRVFDLPVVNDQYYLPPTGEQIVDTTADATSATLHKTSYSTALEQEKQDIISAEDWFEFAAIL